MDEVATAIGALRSTVERTVDAQTAIAAAIADIKAQIHEIKHAQADAAMKVVVLEQQAKAHRDADEAIHSRLLSEVIINRDLATKRFDDLFAWRNKIYGVGAVAVLALTIWGHEVYETAKGLFHAVTK